MERLKKNDDTNGIDKKEGQGRPLAFFMDSIHPRPSFMTEKMIETLEVNVESGSGTEENQVVVY